MKAKLWTLLSASILVFGTAEFLQAAADEDDFVDLGHSSDEEVTLKKQEITLKKQIEMLISYPTENPFDAFSQLMISAIAHHARVQHKAKNDVEAHTFSDIFNTAADELLRHSKVEKVQASSITETAVPLSIKLLGILHSAAHTLGIPLHQKVDIDKALYARMVIKHQYGMMGVTTRLAPSISAYDTRAGKFISIDQFAEKKTKPNKSYEEELPHYQESIKEIIDHINPHIVAPIAGEPEAPGHVDRIVDNALHTPPRVDRSKPVAYPKITLKDGVSLKEAHDKLGKEEEDIMPSHEEEGAVDKILAEAQKGVRVQRQQKSPPASLQKRDSRGQIMSEKLLGKQQENKIISRPSRARTLVTDDLRGRPQARKEEAPSQEKKWKPDTFLRPHKPVLPDDLKGSIKDFKKESLAEAPARPEVKPELTLSSKAGAKVTASARAASEYEVKKKPTPAGFRPFVRPPASNDPAAKARDKEVMANKAQTRDPSTFAKLEAEREKRRAEIERQARELEAQNKQNP